MNKTFGANAVRFIGFFFLQVFIVKNIGFDTGIWSNIHIMIYPVVILLLPISIPTWINLLLAFLLGILIDLFYDSPGVHASALVLVAFIRPVALSIFKPRDGYKAELSPSMANYRLEWFLPYAALLIFVHHIFYYSVEAFSFVYITTIVLKTIFSFMGSMIFILFYQFIFKTTY